MVVEDHINSICDIIIYLPFTYKRHQMVPNTVRFVHSG